jgi:predicted AlkP superfamily pyrophosphatase or phosphodiesterase
MKTILLFVIALCSAVANATERTVVMISLDGARPDYFSKSKTPHIDEMAQRGWSAPLRPIFPTITFPNHASLATGCTAEQHGIMSNSFEDSQRGHFDMSSESEWMQCEPIWVTAERSGIKTAIALWPMSWTPWHGTRASSYFPANPKTRGDAMRTSAKARLDQIIAWLKLPEGERPRLILSWLGEIDHAGHRHGPKSKEVQDAVQKYDVLIGQFLQELQRIPIANSVDVLIVSDHGMSVTEKYISLEYLTHQLATEGLAPSALEHSGPLALIYFGKATQAAQSQKILSQIGKKFEVFEVYTPKTLPPEWHFRNLRSGQIILMAHANTVFTQRGKGDTLLYTPKNDNDRGNHGYPPDNPDMQAVLFAEGPDFPHSDSPAQFKTTDVAPLIKHILSLP